MLAMLTIRETDVFSAWMSALRDTRGKAKIAARVDRLAQGNPGDVAAVGAGVSEMRIDFGPGYRVYYTHHGKEIVVLLCGGDKATQDRDIKRAIKLKANLKD
jgi:putative addiction module killer protein